MLTNTALGNGSQELLVLLCHSTVYQCFEASILRFSSSFILFISIFFLILV